MVGIFVLILGLTLAQGPQPVQGSIASQPTAKYDQVFVEVEALHAKNEYARVVELLGTIPDDAPPRVLVHKHTRIVLALTNLRRLADIPPHLARARQAAQQLNDPTAFASVHNAEGAFHELSGRPDLAISAYERAASLARKAGDRTLLGRVFGELGATYSVIEDWERATYYHQQGFELIDRPTPTQRFNHLMSRGIAAFELYDRDVAEAAFKDGLAIALTSGGKRDESFALGELGYVYWTFDRDSAAAIEYYTRALRLATEAESPGLQATWSLNRGAVRRDTGEYAQALEDFHTVLSLGASGNVFPARKNIGQTYRLMGRLDEARVALESLLRDRPGNPSPRHLWQAHMELASTYEALGLRDRAEAQYRQMLEFLEEHRNTAILEPFRSGSFAHSLRLYDPYDRYMRFLASEAGTARAGDALHVAERARARSFLEMIGSLRSTLAATLPEALLAEQTRIIRTISEIQRKLRVTDLTAVERQGLLAELARAEQARDDFRIKLAVEQPALANARYPQVSGAAELQTVLRPGESAVVFYLSEPESFRWTVSHDRIALQKIASRQAVEARAERLRALLRAPGDVAAFRAEAAALSVMLLSGLETTPGEPLLVVPHGVLHYVPFEALPFEGALLVQRHAVAYAPSLNSYAHLRRNTPDRRTFRVLAVGNPAVDRPDAVTAAARAGEVDTLALLGPLPFAGEELDAIRSTFRWSTDVMSGRDARESALRAENLSRYPIIHFATHGLVNDQRPSRSGLLFSPEAGEDGLLQMPEIYRLDLRADLVVLSACQTALGREVTGEGIVGLTRAFFYAGSRSVLAALWNLNDRFAADFVERFYDEIRAGHPTEEALRRTKVAYLDHPRYSHPFYWSSLVLTGDGTRALYRPVPWRTWIIALAVVLTLSIAAVTLRNRRRAER